MKKLQVSLVAIGLLIPALVFAQYGRYGGCWMNGGAGYNFWPGGLMMLLMMVLFVLVIIALVRWIFIKPSSTNRSGAMAILEERYAKGEISLDQFTEMKKALK